MPDDPDGVDGDTVTVPVVVDDARVRRPARRRARSRCRASRWPGRRGSCSPSSARASGSRGRACRRGARRSARATARCSRGGRRRRGPRRSRASPTRSRARWSHRRPPRSGSPSTRAASRRTGRWGRPGSRRCSSSACAGDPGGELVAGGRVLARAKPRAARPLETTIDTRLQEAAVIGLAGRLGGVAALDPRTGEVRALAGIAFSAPQPPGSTFKIVTATAALERGIVKPSTEFPVETHAIVDGVELENANGESCGGTLPRLVRPLVQLGVRAAGAEDRGGPARGRRRALRLEREGDHPGRGAEHAAAGRRHRHAARGGLDRDRPVRDARHAAPDGVGGADDRDARRALPADALAHPPAARRSASRRGGWRGRSAR